MKTFNIPMIVDGVEKTFTVTHLADEGAARNYLNFLLANSGASYRFI